MRSRTASLVENFFLPLSTRLTVAGVTPHSRATSVIVGRSRTTGIIRRLSLVSRMEPARRRRSRAGAHLPAQRTPASRPPATLVVHIHILAQQRRHERVVRLLPRVVAEAFDVAV